MSHKRSNEDLRGARLIDSLDTARDSAAWQAEVERQAAWMDAAKQLDPEMPRSIPTNQQSPRHRG